MTESATNLIDAVVQMTEGVLIRVHVQPKARREQLIGMHGDRIKLAVTAPPDKGKANAAVARMIAEALNLPPSSIQLLRGETSRQKDLLVQNIDAGQVRLRLAGAMQHG